MRGRHRALVLVMAGLVLLSGCKVEMHVATEVDEDGSGDIAVTVLLGETVRDTLREKRLKTEDPTELAALEARGEDTFARGPDVIDVLARDVPDGWRAERITDGSLEGFRLRAEFESLEKLPALLRPFADWGDTVVAGQGRDAEQVGVAALVGGFSLTRDGSVFRFQASPNAKAYEGAEGGPNGLLTEFTISVKLPGGVREHDADTEEDGKLTWRIGPGASRSISATSDLGYDPSPVPWFLILGATAGVLLAGLLGLRALHRRRGGPPGDEEPPAPSDQDEPVLEPV